MEAVKGTEVGGPVTRAAKTGVVDKRTWGWGGVETWVTRRKDNICKGSGRENKRTVGELEMQKSAATRGCRR